MSEPVDAKEIRPRQSLRVRLTECREKGHDPTEWLPRVAFDGEVNGRIRYCQRCGKRLDYDSFRSDPKKSYVFVDRQWYPEALSCYYTDEPPVECNVCGGDFSPLSVHAYFHIQESDHRSPHLAERHRENHHLEVCASCWQRLARELGLSPKEVQAPTEAKADG